MAIRSIASLSLTFGLVSIPVKVYLATESSAAIKFKLMAASGARVRQQYVAADLPTTPTERRPLDDDDTADELPRRPERSAMLSSLRSGSSRSLAVEDELESEDEPHVLERAEMVKGYEFEKGQFVLFTANELKALEAESRHTIDIVSFIPEQSVDPIYFDRALGGGRHRAQACDAVDRSDRAAVLRSPCIHRRRKEADPRSRRTQDRRQAGRIPRSSSDGRERPSRRPRGGVARQLGRAVRQRTREARRRRPFGRCALAASAQASQASAGTRRCEGIDGAQGVTVAVHEWRSRGPRISAIARELDVDRKTVRSCLQQGAGQRYRRADAGASVLDAATHNGGVRVTHPRPAKSYAPKPPPHHRRPPTQCQVRRSLQLLRHWRERRD